VVRQNKAKVILNEVNLPATLALEWQAGDLQHWIRSFLPDLIVQEGQAGVLAKQDSG
jgi:hypothetical protein